MFFVIGVGLIIGGLICIFHKDLAWKWQERSNNARGVVSKRTEAWENYTTFAGVIGILSGLFAFWLNSL